MSLLTIDMTEQEHQALKAMAALEGKTIKQFTDVFCFPQDDRPALVFSHERMGLITNLNERLDVSPRQTTAEDALCMSFERQMSREGA